MNLNSKPHSSASQTKSVIAAPTTRPQPPEVGPHARYHLTSHNIGLCDDVISVSISFSEGEKRWWSGLEYALYHLDDFDEPSRDIILASAAALFDIPFGEMMGGAQ